jgi:ribA/ribD-fused uncharacterized protein
MVIDSNKICNGKEVKRTLVTDDYVFFLTGPLGNWYPSPLKYSYKSEPEKDFFSAEQLFMYIKAREFYDFETAVKILKCKNSKEAKDLGRQVVGYDDNVWSKVRTFYMMQILSAKYDQCPEFQSEVDNSKYHGKAFVEANPNDKIWSCGLSMDNEMIKDKNNWDGTNLLGNCLDKLRESKHSDVMTKLSFFKNQVVKININKNKFVPYIYGDFIGLLQYDEIVKNYVLNHPMVFNKEKCCYEVISQISNFCNYDVKKIKLTKFDDFYVWYLKQLEFECKLFQEKGHKNEVNFIELGENREDFIIDEDFRKEIIE